jgi:homoserine dehydrogenase
MRLLFVGFGTVGQGLAELLLEKREELSRGYGLDWSVTGIADTIKGSACDPKGLDLGEALERAKRGETLNGLGGSTSDGDALKMIREVDADVMLEATYTDIETGEPATSHVRTALERGMHVTTTNKGPLALHHGELAAVAAEQGVRFLFEGTVMSGTPLLNLIRETLAGAEILELQGILNGTTNFILSQMESGMDYDTALKEAQELGYAEAVPDADVLGWDALAKVTILANVVFGASLKPGDCPCEGITQITPADIEAAGAAGRRYKLIGRVWREGGAVRACVEPRQIETSHPLAGVMGASNSVTLTTDALGEVTIVGPGAGRRETGFSLLNDILTIRRQA